MTDPDLVAAGLLDGLDGDARDERLELLRWLHDDQGYSITDLQRATRARTLILMPSERVIGGTTRFTEREVAERAGVDLTFLRRLQRASGIRLSGEDPDEALYTDIDVEAARQAGQFVANGISEEQVLLMTRVLGRGLGPVAELMRQITFELVLEAGSTELELARSYQAASGMLAPSLGPLLETVLRMHLRHAVETEIVTERERSVGDLPGARHVVVAFADLVGFTRMGQEVPPEVLGAVAARLEDLAAEVVSPSVRVVKTIGDAVLLVGTDPPAMVEAALALIEVATQEGEDFPQLRVGVADGFAVNRAGDWFGAPVNLASRITGVARAGSVVATQQVSEAVSGDDVTWSFAGAKRLKNVTDEVKLFRARRAAPDDAPAPEVPEPKPKPAPKDAVKAARRRRR